MLVRIRFVYKSVRVGFKVNPPTNHKGQMVWISRDCVKVGGIDT